MIHTRPNEENTSCWMREGKQQTPFPRARSLDDQVVSLRGGDNNPTQLSRFTPSRLIGFSTLPLPPPSSEKQAPVHSACYIQPADRVAQLMMVCCVLQQPCSQNRHQALTACRCWLAPTTHTKHLPLNLPGRETRISLLVHRARLAATCTHRKLSVARPLPVCASRSGRLSRSVNGGRHSNFCMPTAQTAAPSLNRYVCNRQPSIVPSCTWRSRPTRPGTRSSCRSGSSAAPCA